ncbi:hypothetical protein PI124_g9437 [Phytophthora idaei]|nr:hypothetical protein PI125_g9212 [Phytophthora idaei]KAG3159033.1 hypothetical protein PI126_g7592 [Phytophthora idaei]KAG3245844.1 hypothetical protein PI124_g9437 [Phytophthora idaei]
MKAKSWDRAVTRYPFFQRSHADETATLAPLGGHIRWWNSRNEAAARCYFSTGQSESYILSTLVSDMCEQQLEFSLC